MNNPFFRSTLCILILCLAGIAQARPPVFLMTNLPNGEVDAEYFVDLIEEEYANGSNTVNITGNLPPGLELIEYDEISDYYFVFIYGTPTQTGTFSFTVEATNGDGSVTRNFTILIKELQPPEITTTTLPNGEVDVFYGELYELFGIEAKGSNISWSIVSGSLPPGLELDFESAERSGRLEVYGSPTQIGTFTFKVKVENAAGNDTKEFTIKITELLQPVITTTALPNGEADLWYGNANNGEGTIKAKGSNTSWSIVSGSLPPGLELSSEWYYGRIYGTPTQTGTYTFTVKVENDAGSDTKIFTIVIKATPPLITTTTTTLPNGEKNANYNYYIEIEAKGLNTSWSIVSGSLPPGLELYEGYSNDYYSYTYISGIPTHIGTYTFTVKATNAGGSDTKSFTIVVTELQKPVITTTTLPNGEKDVDYERSIETKGINLYDTWNIVSGNLPPGLELGHGYIYGTPTHTGIFPFTVKVENDAGIDTKEFTIVITELQKPVIIATSFRSEWVVESHFYNWYAEIATGSNIEWSIVSGQLPDGCDVGKFYSGGYDHIYCFYHDFDDFFPQAQAGTYSFTLKATNAAGSDTKAITLVIEELKKPVITTTTLPNGEADIRYMQEILANGSNVTFSFVSGNLPPGLLFEYGYIFGTPTQDGIYAFTVKAENTAGSDTKELTIVIGDIEPVIPPQIAGSGSLITQARNSINLAAKTNATIEVYNLSGKLISRQNYLAGNHSIPFGHLPKGMYIVKASFGSEKQVLRMPVR